MILWKLVISNYILGPEEGPEGKWELGIAYLLLGKRGFHTLGLGLIGQKKQ